MKKVVMGFIAGAVFATAGSAFAASGLIGKKVDSQYAVTLNGGAIGQAIVIEGTSYLPVRKVADSLSIDVQFSQKGIELSTLTKDGQIDTLKAEKFGIERDIQTAKDYISGYDRLIAKKHEEIEMYKKGLPGTQQMIDGLNGVIADYEQRKADKQKEHDDLQTKMQQLEARLAELEAE